MLGKGTVKPQNGRQLEVIEWHPFPKEMPPESGSYLVTYASGGTNFRHFNKLTETSGQFTNYHTTVIAWAFRPQPYEPKEQKK